MPQLSKKEKYVSVMNALFTFGMAMGNVFLTVFIYSYTNSLVITLLYACIRYFTIPFFSLMSGKLSTKYDLTQILALGLTFKTITFLMLLWVQEGIRDAIWIAYINAITLGAGEGFFWYAMNVMNQKTAQPDTRSQFLSTIGLLNSIASILAPIFTALVLSIVDSESFGFRLIFLVVILMFVTVGYMSHKLSYSYRTPSFEFIQLLKNGSPRWQFQKQASIFHGLRECYIMAFSNLLVFRLLNNSGELLSYYNILVSLILIVTYWIMSRNHNHRVIIRLIYLGGMGLMLSMAILSFSTLPIVALIYGIIHAISTPMYLNGYQMIQMKTYSQEGTNGNITGHIIVVELLMNVGRVFGLSALIMLALFLKDPLYIRLGTLFMMAGALGVLFMIHRLSKKASLI